MFRKTWLIPGVILLGLLSSLLGGCTQSTTVKIKVATSTSLMEYIVQQVGGSHVEVFNMVPPNQHPGNFDITPSAIENLAKAQLFLLHGWPGETYADKIIAAANNPALTVYKATVNGNWISWIKPSAPINAPQESVMMPASRVHTTKLTAR